MMKFKFMKLICNVNCEVISSNGEKKYMYWAIAISIIKHVNI